MRKAAIAPTLAMLAGCAGAGPQGTPAPLEAACRNDGLARFVGQTATADLGARMLAASGARVLRWAPPRSAMTMDFRADRLTIGYDDAMKIVSANCG